MVGQPRSIPCLPPSTVSSPAAGRSLCWFPDTPASASPRSSTSFIRNLFRPNVVDLMVGKLNRLSAETRNALQKLACLGNDAGFTMLRIVYQDSEEEMHGQLWEAVRAGLIFRSEDLQVSPRPC